MKHLWILFLNKMNTFTLEINRSILDLNSDQDTQEEANQSDMDTQVDSQHEYLSKMNLKSNLNSKPLEKHLSYAYILVIIHIAILKHRLPVFLADLIRYLILFILLYSSINLKDGQRTVLYPCWMLHLDYLTISSII